MERWFCVREPALFGHFVLELHAEPILIVLSSVLLCSHPRRGVVFGLWSACASVGNILGACLASSVLQYGYEVGVFFPSFFFSI